MHAQHCSDCGDYKATESLLELDRSSHSNKQWNGRTDRQRVTEGRTTEEGKEGDEQTNANKLTEEEEEKWDIEEIRSTVAQWVY